MWSIFAPQIELWVVHVSATITVVLINEWEREREREREWQEREIERLLDRVLIAHVLSSCLEQQAQS